MQTIQDDSFVHIGICASKASRYSCYGFTSFSSPQRGRRQTPGATFQPHAASISQRYRLTELHMQAALRRRPRQGGEICIKYANQCAELLQPREEKPQFSLKLRLHNKTTQKKHYQKKADSSACREIAQKPNAHVFFSSVFIV
jgi:hypothetical protein